MGGFCLFQSGDPFMMIFFFGGRPRRHHHTEQFFRGEMCFAIAGEDLIIFRRGPVAAAGDLIVAEGFQFVVGFNDFPPPTGDGEIFSVREGLLFDIFRKGDVVPVIPVVLDDIFREINTCPSLIKGCI